MQNWIQKLTLPYPDSKSCRNEPWKIKLSSTWEVVLSALSVKKKIIKIIIIIIKQEIQTHTCIHLIT